MNSVPIKKKYIFVLGLGRSGTTFLTHLISQSSTPLKVLLEPIFRSTSIIDRYKGRTNIFCDPENSSDLNFYKEQFLSLWEGHEYFKKELLQKSLVRNDPSKECLVIKEVHDLLAFPRIVSSLDLDYQVIIISRNTARILDSYYHANHHKSSVSYLQNEKERIDDSIKAGHDDSFNIEKESRIVRYLKKPNIFRKEYLSLACYFKLMNNFLKNWSLINDRVTLVEYEKLASDPMNETLNIYSKLGLSHNQDTLDKIATICKGKEKGNYSVRKNSMKILSQEYKVLSKSQVIKVNALVE